MHMHAPLDHLKALFEPALITELHQFGLFRSFREGDLIVDYGKYIRMMPFVLSGTIKVLRKDESGRELLLYYLSQNESCSMAYTCCLEARKSEVKAVAEDDVEIVGIPHSKLDEWLCTYPSWRHYIIRSFNERFSELLKTVESIAFHKLDQRLSDYLREKERLAQSKLIRVSHQEIAEDLATSRVVVSRLLKQLENEGKLLLYRSEIRLLKEL